MKEENQTKAQLIDEVAELRQRITELEASESQRRRAEEALRESERRYRTLFDNSSDAIFIHDLSGRFLEVNQVACERLGYSREELLQMTLKDIDTPEYVALVAERIEGLHRRDHVLFETAHVRRNGTTFPVELSSRIIEYDGEPAVLSMARDITERKRVEKTIKALAYYDALTGLPNRMLFSDRLKQALSRAHRNRQKLAVMLLDLDHFKDVNDTLGHRAGDHLLQAVGERLANLLRESDTVCRMGEDEFLLLLPEMTRESDVAEVAEKVLKAIRKPVVIGGHELRITTSLGIAVYPEDGEDVDTLLKHADSAMYRAKEEGRDNYQRYS